MKTRKTISNISYNTLPYFEFVISKLVSRRMIDWAYWIEHKPDTDEKKAHIHFVLHPSGQIDTVDLREQFFEIDPTNPKPLCPTMKWHYTNSMEDWLLYAVHDLGYLASKNQRRNFRYEYSDIRSTDYDALNADWQMIDRMKFDRLRLLSEAVLNHVPFVLLVQQGVIPIAMRSQFEFQYNALYALYSSDDCGRFVSHEVDPSTGELLEISAPSSTEKDGQ